MATKKSAATNYKTPLVQLLANGVFILNVTNKEGEPEPVKGRYDMQAIEDFCAVRNIPGVIVLGHSFRVGMMPTDYAHFVLSAVHRIVPKDKAPYTVEDAFNWFTQMGGLASPDFEKLIFWGMQLFVRLSDEAISTVELTDEEKKILQINTPGKK